MNNPIRAALERLLSDIQDLSDSSQGIVGLHRNGDPAPWNELLEGGRYSSWLGDAIAAARAALAEQQGEAIGPEWQPCVKLPITVYVREQRPGETHVSTREGITPVQPDDLIMRGVAGEEYPIGRELFNKTYRLGVEVLTPEARWDLYAGSRSQPPAEGEVAELVAWLQEEADDYECIGCEDSAAKCNRAAELLQQQEAEIKRLRAQQTPVPVSERLPEPEEMDGSLVWCGSQAAGLPYWEWCLDDIRHPGSSGYTHWLPANTPALPTALPVPQGEVQP